MEGGGFSVFSSETLESRLINTSDGVPGGLISDFDIDKDDESWICSTNGIVFFFDATFIFDDDNAIKPFFDTGNLTSSDSYTVIAFDGGNRRWFGTEKGLWLFNENLTELAHHFTSLNSPLPSDNITELAYNPSSGELFVLTDRGLVSFQTASSEPQLKHRNVIIFPNPISRSSNITLAIKGTVADAEIKITDISGNIIAQIQAQGSTASWNMRRHTGELATSGVYIIFSSDENGEETYVGKFVIVP